MLSKLGEISMLTIEKYQSHVANHEHNNLVIFGDETTSIEEGERVSLIVGSIANDKYYGIRKASGVFVVLPANMFESFNHFKMRV